MKDVYIVIDVMRATTTMTIMFDQGARQVLAARLLSRLASKQKRPDRLLCGERHTKTPPGFDCGNSPAYFAQRDLSNHELVLTTSNGTRALFACPTKSPLAGCFYNGRAVTEQALRYAQERQSNIAIVCAASMAISHWRIRPALAISPKNCLHNPLH